jgi:hypothetical protein
MNKRGGWKSVQHVFSTYGHAMDDETITDRITERSADKWLSTGMPAKQKLKG